MNDRSAAVSVGGVSVESAGADLLAASAQAQAGLAGVAAAIIGKDASLWGPDASAEAAIRLGWLDCVEVSRPLVPRIEALRGDLNAAGADHVVLAGMGGSSLAPEVIAATYSVELTTLDTTDPGQIAAALSDRLARAILVVSSKSGGTLETDSHRRAYEEAFSAAGVDPAQRIVVVTDPGSPLHAIATEAGYRIFEADPNIGGRYSALSAFGLVPTGLAGVPVGELLDEAAAVVPFLSGDDGNPALALGAALGGYGNAGHDKIVIADAGSGIIGFGDWAEQLIAESTGKSGRGLLPVVVGSTEAPGFVARADTHLVTLGGSPADPGTSVRGPLGAQFMAWEFATAVAGKVIGIDPFNQPNVQESKDNTNAVLDKAGDGPLPEGEPAFVDGAVEVHGDAVLLRGAADVAGVVAALLGAIPDRGYLAVMAYLDRIHDAAAATLREALAARTPHQVTFGWGPRFLHSTGQFHKGGPPVGVFLQITGAHAFDVEVPGRPFTFGRLQLAQALGDSQAIEGRSRPLVRLHLTDRAAGIDQLLDCGGRRRVMIISGAPGNPLRDPRDRRLPRVPGPCAIVVFGVTGDLARKKLIPAIYDLSNRGLLPPGFVLLGFARRDWDVGDFESLARESAQQYCRTEFRDDVWKRVADVIAVPAGRVRRRRRVRPARAEPHRPRDHARDPGQRGVLPVDPAGRLPGRAEADAAHRDGRQRQERRVAPGRGREAVRPRPRVRTRAELTRRRGLQRRERLPDRPLPGQGNDPEHAGAAVRQHAVRADLERPLRRLGPDHDGRGRRHRRTRRVLRLGRRGSRRSAKPPAPAARAHRDGRAGLLRRRGDPDREAEGSQRNFVAGRPRALRRTGAVRPGLAGRRASAGVPRREGHPEGLAHRDVRRGPVRRGDPTLGRRAVLPAHR